MVSCDLHDFGNEQGLAIRVGLKEDVVSDKLSTTIPIGNPSINVQKTSKFYPLLLKGFDWVDRRSITSDSV
jgi:hypothetical protein